MLGVLAACGGNGTSGAAELHTQRAPSTAGPCLDFVLCIRGDHWDTVQCTCVPDQDDAGATTDGADEAAADAGTETPDSGDEGGDADDGVDASSCSSH